MKKESDSSRMQVMNNAIPSFERFRIFVRDHLNRTTLIISEAVIIAGIIVSCMIYFD